MSKIREIFGSGCGCEKEEQDREEQKDADDGDARTVNKRKLTMESFT